jgi:protein-S-isoprenylcysteine O-methyltransferase Ste14
MKRSLVLGYALISYLVGCAGLAYLILWMAGMLPGAFGAPWETHREMDWITDLLLLTLFGLQHSVMARPGFKRVLRRLLPGAAERATYVLASGLVLLLLVAFWSPMPQSIWLIQAPTASTLLWLLFVSGWVLLFSATFGTNHWELFGLRQAWLYFRRRPWESLPFVRTGLYRYVRHPIMTGLLLGIWATPDMRLEHLLMSTGLTVYIFIGVFFEERDLIGFFGQDYLQYRREVGAVLPRLRRAGKNAG